jgi:ABC-2 type transport system ATP-binding protein
MRDIKYDIEVENLTRTFGDFVAVDHVSFKVRKGEIFGFIGANGAGKTTTIKMLTGILRPTSGTALVAGMDIVKQTNEVKKRIGYMSQRFSLYDDLTVRENFKFYGGVYGLSKKEIKKKTAEMVEKLGMSDILDTLISEIPLGWKQKLAFSVANVHEPEIIFLDEPTSGVDPVTRRQFWDMIYETSKKGTTVLVTTHYMDEAEYCNTVAMMVEGRVKAFGNVYELLKKYRAENMDEIFIKLARS